MLKPGPHAQALQRLMRDLLDTPDGAQYVYRKISGMVNRYDLGNDHPLVGRRAGVPPRGRHPPRRPDGRRPDGVVAWAGDADRDALAQAAKRWFA